MTAVTLLFWLSIAWVLTKETPFSFVWPAVRSQTIQSGVLLTPDYLALLVGLTLYTASFIAEIVRSGISAMNEASGKLREPWASALALPCS